MTSRDGARLRDLVIVAVFALVAGASGLLNVPVLDRDEARFVQATTQMVETGDYVRVRYQNDERNKKPVGIHWLQAASARALGGVEARRVWTYRVPSLLGAVAAAVFTYLAGCALFGRRAALIGAVLLAAAPVVTAEATIAKTDAALLACVCGAMAALARLWLRPEASVITAVCFWVALSTGVLVKGPIAPMVVALAVLALLLTSRLVASDPSEERWLSRLRPRLGLVILAGLTLPWFVAIGLVTDGRFYAEAIGTDMLSKVGEAQESHAGPFGYHALLVWAMFWPAAVFLPATLRAAAAWREPGVRFCLAWLVPAWLVFEVAGTKLPHYTMVTYPAIALLIGWFVSAMPSAHPRWRAAGVALFVVIGVAAAGGVLYLVSTHHADGVEAPTVALVTAFLVALVVSAWLATRRPGPLAAYAVAGTAAALSWLLFQHTVPRLDALAVTPRLAEALGAAGITPRAENAPPIALVGYAEPSAVFTLGTETLLTTSEGGAAWLAETPGGIVGVEARELGAFRTAVGDVPLDVVGEVRGLNYSNGRDVRIVLFRVEEASP